MEGLQEYLLAVAPATCALMPQVNMRRMKVSVGWRHSGHSAGAPPARPASSAIVQARQQGWWPQGNQQALVRPLQANAALVVGVQLSGCRAAC